MSQYKIRKELLIKVLKAANQSVFTDYPKVGKDASDAAREVHAEFDSLLSAYERGEIDPLTLERRDERAAGTTDTVLAGKG